MLAMSLAWTPRPQKRRSSMTKRSRVHQTRANMKPQMMNQEVLMLKEPSSAPSKGIEWSDIPSVLLSQLLQQKITHLSGIFPLFDLQKRNEPGSLQESDQWPGMMSQITLFPDPFQWLCGSVVFSKYAIFPIFKKIIKNRDFNQKRKFLRQISQIHTKFF